MKDTKIPQLIINDLTKKQYESITPAEDQLYITDEEYKDIPIGFGQWAFNKPADNWVEVTDNFVNASDYPEIWNMILGVLDREIIVNGVYVCTVEESEKILSGVKIWEKVTGEQKILKYYIVDRENQKFKFPREIPEDRAVGNNEDVVIAGPSNYNGLYSISNNGKYLECGAFFRVEKATKTVEEESGTKVYTYYKPTQWNNAEAEIPVQVHGDEFHGCIVTEELSALTTCELINDKYRLMFFACQECENEGDVRLYKYDIVDLYPDFHSSSNKTTTDFTAQLCLYDEQYTKSSYLNLKEVIPDGYNEGMITYTIMGYVNPPKVADYTCGNRLYIKVY